RAVLLGRGLVDVVPSQSRWGPHPGWVIAPNLVDLSQYPHRSRLRSGTSYRASSAGANHPHPPMPPHVACTRPAQRMAPRDRPLDLSVGGVRSPDLCRSAPETHPPDETPQCGHEHARADPLAYVELRT